MLPDHDVKPTAPQSEARLLTYQQAADQLVLSPRTLQRAAKAGDLPVLQFGHRTVRIRPADLAAWLQTKSNVLI
jgi:excisionase family DNA binding protein